MSAAARPAAAAVADSRGTAWAFNEPQLQQAMVRHFARAAAVEALTPGDTQLLMGAILKFLKSPEARKLRIEGGRHA